MAGERSEHSADPSNVDEAFEAHIAPARDALAALLHESDGLCDEWGWLPAAESAAMAELDAGAQFEGNPTWGDPVHAAHNLGQTLLFAMGDCVGALVRGLSQGATPVYAHVVLARAALEYASRAGWLFEPAIGLRLRVARGMNERIFGLAQQGRLPLSEQERTRTFERMEELLAEADRFGFETIRDGRIRYLEELRPGQTQLIKKLLSGPDGDTSLGALVYGMFSAVAHGDLWPNVEREGRHNERSQSTRRQMGSRRYEFCRRRPGAYSRDLGGEGGPWTPERALRLEVAVMERDRRRCDSGGETFPSICGDHVTCRVLTRPKGLPPS